MRQVPVRFLILGSGRLATHLAFYFESLSLSFKQWARQTNTEEELSLLVKEADRILFLISDDAISSFFEKHKNLFVKKSCVHFSGALVHPDIPSAHPLNTFGLNLYPDEMYLKTAFVTEKGRPGFSELLPGLPNPSFAIDSEQKPFYHALCVMSGNFTTLLWQSVRKEFSSPLALPTDILLPYMENIFTNLKFAKDKAPLTGPLARGDMKTIQANIESLKEHPFLSIYESFVKTFLKEGK